MKSESQKSSKGKTEPSIASLERQIRLLSKRQANLEVAFAELAAISKGVFTTFLKAMDDIETSVPKTLRGQVKKLMASLGND